MGFDPIFDPYFCTDEKQLNDPDLLTHLKETLALQEKSEEANKKVLKEQAKLMEISQRAKDEGLSVDDEDQ